MFGAELEILNERSIESTVFELEPGTIISKVGHIGINRESKSRRARITGQMTPVIEPGFRSVETPSFTCLCVVDVVCFERDQFAVVPARLLQQATSQHTTTVAATCTVRTNFETALATNSQRLELLAAFYSIETPAEQTQIDQYARKVEQSRALQGPRTLELIIIIMGK